MDVKHRAIIPDMLAFPLYRDAPYWERQARRNRKMELLAPAAAIRLRQR